MVSKGEMLLEHQNEILDERKAHETKIKYELEKEEEKKR
jgi:hypothetical protein